MDRRKFLQLLATTGAGAAAGCNTTQAEKLLPYLEQPKEFTPGTAVYFATTSVEDPDAAGVLARVREGRVVKLEGNPQHPLTQGALSARCQAALQGLYNPDRLTKPMARNADGGLEEIDWQQAWELLSDYASDPSGEHAWLTGHTSTSDADLIDIFSRAAGYRTPVNLRLYSEAPLASAANRLFGTTGMPEFHFENADIIVSLNADFLETWGQPISQTVGYTRMHRYNEQLGGIAIYIGSRQSNTAASCDRWIRLKPGIEASALRVIADIIMSRDIPATSQDFTAAEYLLRDISIENAKAAVGDAYDDLVEVSRQITRSQAPLVIASGLGADAELAHGLALLITHLAGGTGKTLSLPSQGRKPRGNALSDVRGLIKDFAAGQVSTLMVHEANPAFQIAGCAEKLEEGKNLVYFGTQMDETAARADLVIPTHHYLESWGDQEIAAGAIGLVQPVMRPLFGSRALADVVLDTARRIGNRLQWRNGREYIESRLQSLVETIGDEPSQTVRQIKKRGGYWNERIPQTATLSSLATLSAMRDSADEGTPVHFFPHPYWYDGTGADKSWLQEVPETSTSAVWGSWIELHPDTAKDLGVDRGDALKLQANGAEITVPVLPTIQMMPGVLAMPIGQGHEELGRYARNRGANPLALCDFTNEGTGMATSGLSATVTAIKGGGKKLITMAGSQDQGEREIARAITVPPDGHIEAPEEDEHHHIDLESTFYEEFEYELYDWGMTIDLDKCVGCGACAVACYAENNIGVVGEQSMREGREMSWIRIEKYTDGEDTRMIPNLCQQCHHAPCEPVCPVQAAYHTDEGLNGQVYNRCVGTRYCSNNCPYKVRRFNWFDYDYPAPLHLQLNPDVTVRERGVMEKCTFCVQRIKISKENAKNDGMLVKDGDTYMDGFELQPACAQTCPADVFTFGNLKDENSAVSKQYKDKRAYRLLEELGTRPSVTYLKKVIRTDV